MVRFIITLLVCTAAGLLMKRWKVPGGMLVGALIGGALLNVLTPYGYMPYAGRFSAQVAAGAYIGALFDRGQLKSVRRVWKPYLSIMFFFLAANLLAGFLIWKTGACDLMTALLCCVPGGMSDTPLIAADLGADVGTVAILQFVRMVTGVVVMPSVIALLVRPGDPVPSEAPPLERTSAEAEPAFQERVPKTVPLAAVTVAVAAVGGGLGKAAGIPAGILVGAMAAVIVMNLTYGRAYLPMPLKRAAQVLSGAYIGCTLTAESIRQLRNLILPAVIILAVYIPMSLLCGWLNAKVFHRDTRESMLSATPGGASDMALIAADLGVESADLMVTQVLRMVTVVLLFPQLVYHLCALLGQLPG